eukprot:Blabericola_migrator_1__4928@NODE_256_length_10795_cov_202_211130_g214_i0_p2_GENE_NODE_256_length_10795_cov_202_211130_g214_i0NODE_256_length_10795_cov_202_211130_g214_i0_p2_ORF_typecomplete_len515_score38_08_NODE_256_length_10795_cov_202_211130_g214_i02241546
MTNPTIGGTAQGALLSIPPAVVTSPIQGGADTGLLMVESAPNGVASQDTSTTNILHNANLPRTVFIAPTDSNVGYMPGEGALLVPALPGGTAQGLLQPTHPAIVTPMIPGDANIGVLGGTTESFAPPSANIVDTGTLQKLQPAIATLPSGGSDIGVLGAATTDRGSASRGAFARGTLQERSGNTISSDSPTFSGAGHLDETAALTVPTLQGGTAQGVLQGIYPAAVNPGVTGEAGVGILKGNTHLLTPPVASATNTETLQRSQTSNPKPIQGGTDVGLLVLGPVERNAALRGAAATGSLQSGDTTIPRYITSATSELGNLNEAASPAIAVIPGASSVGILTKQSGPALTSLSGDSDTGAIEDSTRLGENPGSGSGFGMATLLSGSPKSSTSVAGADMSLGILNDSGLSTSKTGRMTSDTGVLEQRPRVGSNELQGGRATG